MRLPFFTIGHSNRSLDEFTRLLLGAGIGIVADVRKLPRSRANPQFNEEALPGSLAALDVSYQHFAALGGRRGKSRTSPRDLNGLWTNESFHNYADYALTAEFRAALARLREAGRDRRCAIMCSEALWWRCHRRIVADQLIARGETVFHVIAEGRLEPARLTAGAVIRDRETVVYPAEHRTDA
ncbi:MAG: DUF488 family protein [Steroidobacteraceae bacterium]